jgi:hypothetical protein
MALYSKRIASNTLLISDHPNNSNICYTWTKGGPERNGVQRYVCTACRSLRDRGLVPKTYQLPARNAIGGSWDDDGPNHVHFCEGIPRNRVAGEQVAFFRKIFNFQLKIGAQKRPSRAGDGNSGEYRLSKNQN